MKIWKVKLIGFFDEVVFATQTEARDKAHAIRIASAIYGHCWERALGAELK